LACLLQFTSQHVSDDCLAVLMCGQFLSRLSFSLWQGSVAVACRIVEHEVTGLTQGFCRSGKTGKCQGICVVGKGQGKILFLKSQGK